MSTDHRPLPQDVLDPLANAPTCTDPTDSAGTALSALGARLRQRFGPDSRLEKTAGGESVLVLRGNLAHRTRTLRLHAAERDNALWLFSEGAEGGLDPVGEIETEETMAKVMALRGRTLSW